MLALNAYRAGLCPDCGYHHDLATDPDFYWTFTPKVCPVCESAAPFMRAQHEADDKAVEALGKNPLPTVPRPDDGRRIVIQPTLPPD